MDSFCKKKASNQHSATYHFSLTARLVGHEKNVIESNHFVRGWFTFPIAYHFITIECYSVDLTRFSNFCYSFRIIEFLKLVFGCFGRFRWFSVILNYWAIKWLLPEQRWMNLKVIDIVDLIDTMDLSGKVQTLQVQLFPIHTLPEPGIFHYYWYFFHFHSRIVRFNFGF